MPGPYQQLADPNQLADAGQLAQSQDFWRALMQLQAQQSPDQLMPPPRNPAAPADWAANAVRGAAGKISDIVTLPGRAMQQGITTEEAVPWATDTALNLAGGGAPMAERGAAGAFGGRLPTYEGPIRAYHSSPHDFERFDLSKIGTGEGAQSYGHGIYAAENPAVSGQGGQYWQEFTRKFGENEREAARHLQIEGFDRDKAIARVEGYIGNIKRDIASPKTPLYDTTKRLADYEEQLRFLTSGKPVGARTYEIGINARPEEMLNWDKPLREQSELLDALSGSRRKAVKSSLEAQDYLAPTRQVYGRDIGPVTGENFYKTLSLNLEGKTSSPQASSALNAAGIPGIKYLDQGSRLGGGNDRSILQNQLRATEALHATTPTSYTAREIAKLQDLIARTAPQTHNYVVFDPKKIDIYRKYGLAGAVPAGGLAAAASQQDSR